MVDADAVFDDFFNECVKAGVSNCTLASGSYKQTQIIHIFIYTEQPDISPICYLLYALYTLYSALPQHPMHSIQLTSSTATHTTTTPDTTLNNTLLATYYS